MGVIWVELSKCTTRFLSERNKQQKKSIYNLFSCHVVTWIHGSSPSPPNHRLKPTRNSTDTTPNVLAWPNRINNSFNWQAIHTESFPLSSCERHTLLQTRTTPTTEVTERPSRPGHVRLATQRESSHVEERHRNSSTRMTKAIITQYGITLGIAKTTCDTSIRSTGSGELGFQPSFSPMWPLCTPVRMIITG